METLNTSQLTELILQQNATIYALQNSLDSFFLWTNGMVIFLMAAGFAFLEAGAIQSKNVVHTLLISFSDVGLCILAWWCIGFPFSFGGGGPFIGSDYYASYDMTVGTQVWGLWFFELTFAMTAVSIPSGAVLERIEFLPFALYTIVMAGFIYPVVVHWAWNPVGWLAQGLNVTTSSGTALTITYLDFAGSGVVHVTGGAAAFVGAAMLGPRKAARDALTKARRAIPYHSEPMTMLGCFILMFGFFAFNGGSQTHVSQPGDGQTSAMVVVNTAICGASASVTSLVLSRAGYFSNGRWSTIKAMNGFLVGQVAICSGCAYVRPYGAFCIGIVAGFTYMTYAKLVAKAGVDDPLEATAVHFGGGSCGTILTAFFNRNPVYGVLLGGTGYSIAWQLVGVLAIAGFSAAVSAVYFGFCMLFKVYRSPEEEEELGLDWATAGELAYPFNAFHEGWVSGVDELGNYIVTDDPRTRRSKRSTKSNGNGTEISMINGSPFMASPAPYYSSSFGASIGSSFAKPSVVPMELTPMPPPMAMTPMAMTPMPIVDDGRARSPSMLTLPRVPVNRMGESAYFPG